MKSSFCSLRKVAFFAFVFVWLVVSFFFFFCFCGGFVFCFLFFCFLFFCLFVCLGLISDGTEKIRFMIGTFLYVFGSRERHSKLKNRDVHPIQTDTKRRHSYSLTFL